MPDATAVVLERGATLRNEDLRRCDLRGRRISELRLVNCDLSGADLSGAALSRVDISLCDLRGALLEGATVEYALAAGASFAGCHAPGLVVSHTNLHGADLSAANLRGAALTSVSLEGASLRGAELSGALITYSNCRAAAFDAALLEQVNGLGTTFAQASFTGARDFSQTFEIVAEILAREAGSDLDFLRTIGAIPLARFYCYAEWRAYGQEHLPDQLSRALEIFDRYPESGCAQALRGGS
jgi:uncharacterized protein YjbI with pentapeptide repeats